MPKKPTYARSFASGPPTPGARTEQTQAFKKEPAPVPAVQFRGGKPVEPPVTSFLASPPPVAGSTATAGTTYTLPIATQAVIGGVKVGDNLAVTTGGILSANLPLFLTTTATAGAALGGHRAVIYDDTGAAQYADSTVLMDAGAVVGLTLGAAAAGDTVAIATSGAVSEPSWAWAERLPVFLGTNGLLTQTPPVAGFMLPMGVPLSPTTLLLRVQSPLILL